MSKPAENEKQILQARSQGRSHRLVVAALLLLTAFLAINSLVGDSITFDETAHLTAGMSYLMTGDFRLAPETPPLAQMWAACPLLLLDARWCSPHTPGWREGDVWRVGRIWLFDLTDGERLLLPARCMMVLLLVATCLSTYALARTLFGHRAAILALTLAALSPTYLAHGRLVTADMPATLCMTVTLLAFSRLLQRITWTRLLLAFLATAAVSLVKFSWPLILPALAVMAVFVVCRRCPIDCAPLDWAARRFAGPKTGSVRLAQRWRRAVAIAAIMLLVGATTWVSIWACFGLRYSPFCGEDRDRASILGVVHLFTKHGVAAGVALFVRPGGGLAAQHQRNLAVQINVGEVIVLLVGCVDPIPAEYDATAEGLVR